MGIKTLKQCVNKSLNAHESVEYDCNVELDHDGQKVIAYSVSIAHRDLLFYTSIGTLNYLVDSYGDNHRAELYKVELG